MGAIVFYDIAYTLILILGVVNKWLCKFGSLSIFSVSYQVSRLVAMQAA